MSESKRPTELAKIIHSIFNGNRLDTEIFWKLKLEISNEMQRIIRRHQLQKTVTSEQLEEALSEFISDLSSSPDDNRFIAQLKSICLRNCHDSLSQMQHYISRRIFSFMKVAADTSSKEYFKFNEQVKYHLSRLCSDNKIKSLHDNYYTAGNQTNCPIMYESQLSDYTLSKISLKRKLSKKSKTIRNINLKESILTLLSDDTHINYRFKRQNIVQTLYSMVEQVRVESLINGKETLYHRQKSSFGLDLMLIKIDATAEMIQMLSNPSKPEKQTQVLLCGLGYTVATCPDYFKNSDLREKDYNILTCHKMGIVDKIHKFLNEIELFSLPKLELKRTTVNNRIKDYKRIISSILVDYSIEEQQASISEFTQYLIEQYSALIRRS